MSNVYSLNLTKDEEEKLYQAFFENATEAPQYAKWQLKVENCVITCYESGKTVFQGKDAEIYASPYIPIDNETYPQAGSDEVGTGDYFGPVCVCATYIDEKHAQYVKDLGVRDSKAITDEKILQIAPILINEIPYSLLIVNNEKYNEVHATNNLNMIKAKLHNQAYINLSKKMKLPSLMIIDQFAPEKTYYKYLQDEENVIKGISFYTKAEDQFTSVACASIIARYAFIQEMNKLEDKYHMQFQKGSGSLVDECAKEFVSKYGKDELPKVAKIHFKNTERID